MFGWDLPPGCTLNDIDELSVCAEDEALFDDETLVALFAPSLPEETPMQKITQESTRNTNLLMEINATTTAIQSVAGQYPAADKACFAIGALRSMLAGMAGLGDFACHASCFDSATVDAVKRLLDELAD